MTQDDLRTINCLSYEEFRGILGEGLHISYLNEKWESFRSNLANFLMNLDDDNFKNFVSYAKQKYSRR